MSEIEIIEAGNKLIADFDGFILSDQDRVLEGYDRWNNEIYRNFDETDLKYHSSWDWLMPVVEKINKIGVYDVIIYKTTCHINDEREILIETANNDLRYCVWLAVVEFLKWQQEYITNKKKGG